ncbi:MAG: hypothetical protein K5860_02490, partial [Bacteroidales bacterium]|nr:hypothetical protein [Bacteroidales bacterium]
YFLSSATKSNKNRRRRHIFAKKQFIPLNSRNGADTQPTPPSREFFTLHSLFFLTLICGVEPSSNVEWL